MCQEMKSIITAVFEAEEKRKLNDRSKELDTKQSILNEELAKMKGLHYWAALGAQPNLRGRRLSLRTGRLWRWSG